jgi:caprin-1
MPSLAAKPEKIASFEAADPVKQIVQMLEKRIRNLEKRKMKLDNYRLDVKNGKELNEDQKIAVSKYDQVESLLEFSRELSKSMQSVVLESARQQKKLAKKEQLERQQHEIQRLQEAYMYCHILSSFQNEDVRNDFLKGENGAVQLTSEQLSQLDQLFKLIGPGLPAEQADLSNHFHTLAENHIFLVEGKNKEIVGTTYKVLKDLVVSIKDCGYFSKPSGPMEEDGTSSEDIPEDEVSVKNDQKEDSISNADIEQQQEELNYEENSASSVPPEEIAGHEMGENNNAPLQDVLSSESAFNFLQESQIDIGDPHLDPAVVAVHQIAPPPPPTHVNFPGTSYPASSPVEEKPLNGSENCDIINHPPQVNHVSAIPNTISRTTAPAALSAVQLSSQQDFDPSHPIPTQTFTNQSFAVMQNMIMPQGYVPVTMHHAPMPPHAIAPIAVVPPVVSTTVTTGTSVVPLPVPMAPVSVPPVVSSHDEAEPKIEVEEEKPLEENGSSGENESNTNNSSNEKNGENGYAPSYRGGYRRGRGRGNNGYFRGRSNYGGRGGFQNHYYQDRNGYNGNYRKNNNRGK